MKRWLVLLMSALEASIFLAVVYFEPTYGVRGKLWGETFFRGRPSSYWAAELERWEVRRFVAVFGAMEQPMRIRFFHREPTWFESMRTRWLSDGNQNKINVNTAPEVFCDDANAKAVLEDLRKYSSPKVVRLATIGLGLDPEFPP